VKAIKNILVVILSVVVMISTTGLTVFEHKCNHTGLVQVSLFADLSSCCHTEQNVQACCISISTCQIQEDSKCCEESVVIYRIKSPLDIKHQEIKKLFSPITLAEAGLNHEEKLDNTSLFDYVDEDEIVRKNSPPLFILYHQLKIMPSS
jgi:hypothetical protein